MIGSLLLLFAIIRASKKRPNFDLADIITGDNGRISGSKAAMALACFTTTWVLIHVTSEGNLEEWIYVGYLVTWAGASLGNKYVTKDQVVSSVTSTTTTTQAPTTVTTVAKVDPPLPSPTSTDVVNAALDTVEAAKSTVDAAIAEQKRDLT